jgi:hypothetical protein
MSATVIYALVFVFLLLIALYLQKKYCILSNSTAPQPKPYSFSRWQLVWWTFLIFASFLSIILASGKIPTFDNSTLILLGIGSITTIAATLIDISDTTNLANTTADTDTTVVVTTPSAPVTPPPGTTAADAAPNAVAAQTVVTVVTPAKKPLLAQHINHNSFMLDILSDKHGINIHRLQAFFFDIVFGGWFIYTTFIHIKGITTASTQAAIDSVIPIITPNNLILLGMSAGIYTTLKSTENK